MQRSQRSNGATTRKNKSGPFSAAIPQTHRTHSGRRAKRTLAIYFGQKPGGPTTLLSASALCLRCLLPRSGMEPLCDHRMGALEGVSGEGGAQAPPPRGGAPTFLCGREICKTFLADLQRSLWRNGVANRLKKTHLFSAAMPQAHRTHSGRRAKRTLDTNSGQRLEGPTTLFAVSGVCLSLLGARTGYGAPLRSCSRHHRADEVKNARSRIWYGGIRLHFCAHMWESRRAICNARCGASGQQLEKTKSYRSPRPCQGHIARTAGGGRSVPSPSTSVKVLEGRPAFLLASALRLRRLLRGSGMEPLCDHAATTTERMKSRTQGAVSPQRLKTAHELSDSYSPPHKFRGSFWGTCWQRTRPKVWVVKSVVENRTMSQSRA